MAGKRMRKRFYKGGTEFKRLVFKDKLPFPLVIAEIGSNHMGREDLGIELIKIAKEAGAHVAKFQWIDRERIWVDPSVRPEWTQVSEEFLQKMARACFELDIEFMCTPTAPWQIERLDPLVQRWKVGSAHFWDLELIKPMRMTTKPILASTGLAKPWQLELASWAIPMCCVSTYPARAEDYGLADWLAKVRPLAEWGLSDHTTGSGIALAAWLLGVKWIEKHIKLPDQPPSPDSGPHALGPVAFAAYISQFKEIQWAHDNPMGESNPPKGRKIWV